MRTMLLALIGCLVVGHTAEAQHPLKFETKLLTVDANEGCDVADIDGDGKLDVIAGRNWFRNGEWVARPVRAFDDWNGYVDSNGDFLFDVDRDGWVDVIAGAFIPTEVYWYKNPGPEGLAYGSMWEKHLLADTALSQNEASYLHDIDGDGTPEWISNSWKKDNPLVIWRITQVRTSASPDATYTLTPHTVGDSANGHGIGFGDINNDGREDILVGTGWYERPEGDPYATTWKYHADWDRHMSCPVLVKDLNQDGKNDVIVGNPHDFGIFAWMSNGVGEDGSVSFEEVVIDRSFSQPHCLTMADLDGDGKDELITGKRVRAHNGRDPGGTDPPVVCYFTFDEETSKFEKHEISRGDVGIGLQIRTADINDDGRLDIVVAGKDGTQILFNQGAKSE